MYIRWGNVFSAFAFGFHGVKCILHIYTGQISRWNQNPQWPDSTAPSKLLPVFDNSEIGFGQMHLKQIPLYHPVLRIPYLKIQNCVYHKEYNHNYKVFLSIIVLTSILIALADLMRVMTSDFIIGINNKKKYLSRNNTCFQKYTWRTAVLCVSC